VPASLEPGIYVLKVRNPGGLLSSQVVIYTLYSGEITQINVYKGYYGDGQDNINPRDGVRVEVSLQMVQSFANSLVVIVIEDPDSKQMLAAVQGPLPAENAVNFSASFTLPDKTGTYKAKAFVWTNWTTMAPLAEPQVHDFLVQL